MRLGVAHALVAGELVRGDVEVADGRVVATGLLPPGASGLAAPGFIDLQVNGFDGVDLLSADVDGVRRAGEAQLRHGVTSYQPTFITGPEATVTGALARLGEAQRVARAPRILGAHLEGPFLSPARLGTHPPEWRRDPDPALLERLLAAGPVTHVTLAPELPGALELVDVLVARGVTVSLGHTDATARDASLALGRGARTVTHLFNAMRPFGSREPGVAGLALARRDVPVQLIVDGVHLDDETVRLVFNAAAGRAALVTDAIAGAGLGDGRYRLGTVDVEVRDGVARRADGVLAGSVVTMDRSLRRLAGLGVPLAEALSAASAVPARIARRRDLGTLEPGARADVVVLDDRLEVMRVLVGGATAYSR